MKTIFIDTETTGTDPKRHGLIQLAAITLEPSEHQFNLLIQPFPDDVVEDEALKVSGITKEEIAEVHVPPSRAYNMFTNWLSHRVDRFNRADKFQVIAYNADFDMDFLRAFFKKNNDQYFGSFFYWKPIDVAAIICFYDEIVGNPVPVRHATLVDQLHRFELEIPGNLHDAMADIRATAELYFKVKNLILGHQSDKGKSHDSQ